MAGNGGGTVVGRNSGFSQHAVTKSKQVCKCRADLPATGNRIRWTRQIRSAEQRSRFPVAGNRDGAVDFHCLLSQSASANRLDWQPSPDLLSCNAGTHESAMSYSRILV